MSQRRLRIGIGGKRSGDVDGGDGEGSSGSGRSRFGRSARRYSKSELKKKHDASSYRRLDLAGASAKEGIKEASKRLGGALNRSVHRVRNKKDKQAKKPPRSSRGQSAVVGDMMRKSLQ
jgi:hypothetical protein